MLEEQATIVRVDGETAWVEGVASGGCGGCTQACASRSLHRYFDRRRAPLAARCTLPVRPGDRVVIGVDERAMLCGSLLVYVLPLCGLLAGAALAEWWGSEWMVASDWLGLPGGAFGFVVTLIFVKKRLGLGSSALQPVVLRKESLV